MCRKLIFLVSLAASMLSLTGNAQAGEATADAFVRGPTYDNTNYGTGGSVTLKNSGGNSYDRKGYIRFDVSGTVMEASLDLTVSTNNPGGTDAPTPQTFTVEVYGLAESLDHTWVEDTITWNNAPGNDTSSSNFRSDAMLLGSFVVDQTPVGDTITFSDPNLVDFINADTDNQITLMLRRTPGTSSSHNLAFASKESTTYSAPTLNMKPATQAFSPSPADGAFLDATWASLSWRAMDSAVSHDVYIGNNFDDVNNGTGGTFWGNQAAESLFVGFPGYPYPDGLVPGSSYYWRIDEVNAADPNSPWKGSVWSFSTAPYTAYAPVPADGAGSVALNTTLSWAPGSGAKLHTVYFGENFDDVNNASTGGTMGAAVTYSPSSLKAAKVYYWRVDETNPPNTYKGQVWSFTTVGAVGNPYPANGASDAEMNVILTWTPGDKAGSHQVYFGTDKEALRKATAASPEYKGVKALGAESFDPGMLASGSTFYWRVDEVNNTNPESPWKGPVWSFTTGNSLLLENFESYNDIDPPAAGSNRIFDKWIDGFGTTTNGALVGNNLPPYAEQTIVHGGKQSMPLAYDNNLKYSEATMTLSGASHDWTQQGVANLTLWLRGMATNSAEQMYVALNGTTVVYNTDTSLTQKTSWTQWVVPLQQFAGVNLANVTSITLGVGTKGNTTVAGGTGKMYFDDIRLSRPATP